MLNIFKRGEDACNVRPDRPDKIAKRVSHVRFLAESLLQKQSERSGLHKMEIEHVRKAVSIAHQFYTVLEHYEAELREQELRRSLKETAFTPKETADA
jgi:hypothetical protein